MKYYTILTNAHNYIIDICKRLKYFTTYILISLQIIICAPWSCPKNYTKFRSRFQYFNIYYIIDYLGNTGSSPCTNYVTYQYHVSNIINYCVVRLMGKELWAHSAGCERIVTKTRYRNRVLATPAPALSGLLNDWFKKKKSISSVRSPVVFGNLSISKRPLSTIILTTRN